MDVVRERHGHVAQPSANPPDVRLPAQVEIACFRIAQEALTNVALHARARNVVVALEDRERESRLSIRDDGVGFDPDASRSTSKPRLLLAGLIDDSTAEQRSACGTPPTLRQGGSVVVTGVLL